MKEQLTLKGKPYPGRWVSCGDAARYPRYPLCKCDPATKPCPPWPLARTHSSKAWWRHVTLGFEGRALRAGPRSDVPCSPDTLKRRAPCELSFPRRVILRQVIFLSVCPLPPGQRSLVGRRDVGMLEHDAPAYYVSRDGVTKEYVRGGRAAARRLRRHPTAAELRSLDETPASTATLLGEDGPVIVVREYAETEPTLLMGRERFVSVDDNCSAELRELTIDESAAAAPVAQACGPPLLPAAQGGPPEFSTLCEALEHTARHAPADCGITYVSRGRAVFESYAALRAEAGRMLGGLRALGLAPRGVVALQLLEPQLHLRAVWACALGGFPSVTVAVAPKLSPQAELRSMV